MTTPSRRNVSSPANSWRSISLSGLRRCPSRLARSATIRSAAADHMQDGMPLRTVAMALLISS